MMLYQNKELGGRERKRGGNGKINEREGEREREEVGERKRRQGWGGGVLHPCMKEQNNQIQEGL